MSKRLAAASLGFCLAALITTGAEARLEQTSRRDHDTEGITSRNFDRNSTIYSKEESRGVERDEVRRPAPKRQARVRSGKRTAYLSPSRRKTPAPVTAPAPAQASAPEASAPQAAAPTTTAAAAQPTLPPVTERAVTNVHDDPEAPRNCLAFEAKVLLARIEQVFGPVGMVSTCRPGAVIAGSGKPSLHRYGRAIDFDAGSRKSAIVKWLIEHHKTGGTMTYSGMSHVHVDIGPHFVSLGSGGRVASRSRSRARYARN